MFYAKTCCFATDNLVMRKNNIRSNIRNQTEKNESLKHIMPNNLQLNIFKNDETVH